MAGHVCPWWCAYTFDNRFRSLIHNVEQIVGPHVGEGMTVMDIGCGMGFFALGMARLVGDSGRVIAVDLQPRMLDVVRRRAAKAGLADRIVLHPCEADSLGLDTPCDFVLAFWMVHEVPDVAGLFSRISSILKPGGKLLIAEPIIHVPRRMFEQTVSIATDNGLVLFDRPRLRLSRAVLLHKATSK